MQRLLNPLDFIFFRFAHEEVEGVYSLGGLKNRGSNMATNMSTLWHHCDGPCESPRQPRCNKSRYNSRPTALRPSLYRGRIFTSTILAAIAEIGDKTQLLSFVLSAKLRRPYPIMTGIFAATLLNHAFAASVGAWLASLIPAHFIK